MTDHQTWLTAEVLINAPVEKVWEFWAAPRHIKQWNNVSEDWHTSQAENDLRAGGKLFLRMEAKNGSSGFDFEGIYDDVLTNKKISYTISDGRKTTISFTKTEKGIKVTETFQPVKEHSLEFQQSFCQAILNKFKIYTEHTVIANGS